MEFTNKVDRDIFPRPALRSCIVSIHAGLFLPKAAKLEGKSALETRIDSGYHAKAIQHEWNRSGLTPLTVAPVTEAWGQIPEWRKLLRNESRAQEFMLAQSMISHLELHLGSQFWRILQTKAVETHGLWGFRRATDLYYDGGKFDSLHDTLARFEQLASYRSPVEEKYSNLFNWWKLRCEYQEHTPEPKQLLSEVQREGYSEELKLLRYLPPDANIVDFREMKNTVPAVVLH